MKRPHIKSGGGTTGGSNIPEYHQYYCEHPQEHRIHQTVQFVHIHSVCSVCNVRLATGGVSGVGGGVSGGVMTGEKLQIPGLDRASSQQVTTAMLSQGIKLTFSFRELDSLSLLLKDFYRCW